MTFAGSRAVVVLGGEARACRRGDGRGGSRRLVKNMVQIFEKSSNYIPEVPCGSMASMMACLVSSLRTKFCIVFESMR